MSTLAVSTDQAAKLLNTSVFNVRLQILAGKIPTLPSVGRHHRIPLGWILAQTGLTIAQYKEITTGNTTKN